MTRAAVEGSPVETARTAVSPVLLSLALHTGLLLLPLTPLLRGDPLPPGVRRPPVRAEAVFAIVPLPEPRPAPAAREAPRVPAAPGPAAAAPTVTPAPTPPVVASEPVPAEVPAPAPPVAALPAAAPPAAAPPVAAGQPAKAAPSLPAYVSPPVLLASADPTAPAFRATGFTVAPPSSAPAPAGSATPPAAAEQSAASVSSPAPAAAAAPDPPPAQAAAPSPPRVAARLLERPAPRYPAAARRSGQAGTVHLRLEVRTDGRVGRVEVAATSGFLLLDEAAVASARSWRFSPAKENGRLVAEWRRVAVEFRLEDAAGQG